MDQPKHNNPIIALHGFLGRPSDWDILELDHLYALDLFAMQGMGILEEWASQINAGIQKPHHLIAYSLGGRLGLHALIQAPHLWSSAVIISAHPGLSSESDKKFRLESDLQWSHRFQNESWASLMKAWNSRDIFLNTIHPERFEKDYNRSQLSKVLTGCSLGLQSNLTEQISQLPMPILWVVGSQDLPYLSLASTLSFRHPRSKIIIVPGGHRLLWEQPQLLKPQLAPYILATA